MSVEKRIVGICPFCREQLRESWYGEGEFEAHYFHDCETPPVVCDVGPHGIDESEVDRVRAASQNRWSHEREDAYEDEQRNRAWWKRFYALSEDERMARYGYRTRSERWDKELREGFSSEKLNETLFADNPLFTALPSNAATGTTAIVSVHAASTKQHP